MVSLIDDIWPIILSNLSSLDRSRLCTVSKLWAKTLIEITSRQGSRYRSLIFARADFHRVIREQIKAVDSKEFDLACLSGNLDFVKLIVKRGGIDTVSDHDILTKYDVPIFLYLETYLRDKHRIVFDHSYIMFRSYMEGNIALIDYLEGQGTKLPNDMRSWTIRRLIIVNMKVIDKIVARIKMDESIRYILNINNIFTTACRHQCYDVLRWMIDTNLLSDISQYDYIFYECIKDDDLRNKISKLVPTYGNNISYSQRCYLAWSQGDLAYMKRILADHYPTDEDIVSLRIKPYLYDDLSPIEMAHIKQIRVCDITDDIMDEFTDNMSEIKRLIDKIVSIDIRNTNHHNRI